MTGRSTAKIVRGLDVFELLPSEHISENEIAAAKLASQGNIFNPQQQLKVSWPANPVVANPPGSVDEVEIRWR